MNEEKLYLGIDWGESKIGLSIGNDTIKIATPLKVVSSLDEIVQIVKDENISEIIIGRPLSMNVLPGEDNPPLSKNFIDFFGKLKEATGLPVAMVDERLTTREADRMIIDGSRKEDQDALAAMLILQSFFDKMS